jgi:hypothetical protein
VFPALEAESGQSPTLENTFQAFLPIVIQKPFPALESRFLGLDIKHVASGRASLSFEAILGSEKRDTPFIGHHAEGSRPKDIRLVYGEEHVKKILKTN